MIAEKETQCKLIIEHMEKNGSLTPLQALEYFGCMRLPARICDLRKKGYIIETDIIHQNGKHFARYILKGHINGRLS